MEVIFKYEENEYVPISTISVIGEFNNFNPNDGIMVKENDMWVLKCVLQPGEYKYKFLINKELKLNDPIANIYLPDENESLWSTIIINDKNERMYNNTQYTTHIEKYDISSTVSEDEILVNKKTFNTILDKKVVTRFQFTNVTGLHAVTTAWYNPIGELFQITENNLFNPPENKKAITLWFWMDLDNKSRKYQLGTWKIKLFIDGEFILEDEFTLLETGAYSANGQMTY